MIEGITRADPVAWEQAFARFNAAKAVYGAIEMPRDDAILDATLDKFCEAEEDLLRLPAPNLGAVIDKLMIIWVDEIPSNSEEAAQKRMVIGDLRRVQILNGLR